MNVTALRWLSRVALVAVAMVGGCRLATFADPNVAPVGSLVDAHVLRRNLEEVHRNLERRIAKGEITRTRKNELIKQYCDKMLVGINLRAVPKGQAWEYADVVRQADRWDQAYDLL